MTHHINLLDAARLLPPRVLPAWTLPAVAGTALLIGGALRLGAGLYLHPLAESAAALQAEVSRLQALPQEGPERSVVLAALREQAGAREHQVRQMQGLDGAAPAGRTGLGQGPLGASQWMQALAAVATEGVWLTQVKVDAGGALALEGRASDGVQVNTYLAKWRDEPALAGTALKLLELRLAESGDRRGASAGTSGGSSVDTSANEMAFSLGNAPTAGALPAEGPGAAAPAMPVVAGGAAGGAAGGVP